MILLVLDWSVIFDADPEEKTRLGVPRKGAKRFLRWLHRRECSITLTCSAATEVAGLGGRVMSKHLSTFGLPQFPVKLLLRDGNFLIPITDDYIWIRRGFFHAKCSSKLRVLRKILRSVLVKAKDNK